MFGDRDATKLKSSEIEDWLDEILVERDLAIQPLTKCAALFHGLQAWKAEGTSSM